MSVTAAELARHIKAELEGDGSVELTDLRALSEAGRHDLSFLSNPRYAPQLDGTKAGAVIVAKSHSGPCTAKATLRVDNPDKAFMLAAEFFAPPAPEVVPGIHPTAVVGKGVELGKGVSVGPYSVICDGAKIGARTVIDAQCFVGAGSEIGEDGHMYPQSVVRERCRIGKRAIIHCGAVIGGDGFGYLIEPRPLMLPKVTKIPQIGTVEIGDDFEIGCNATIDRARFGATKIGNTVKIDNLVQVGHNVRIGDCSGLIAQCGVAGSTHIGRGVMIWAQAGLSGHLHVGDGSQVGPQAGVTKDVDPGTYVLGAPAQPKREFAETLLAPRSVASLKKRVAELEARLAKLESGK